MSSMHYTYGLGATVTPAIAPVPIPIPIGKLPKSDFWYQVGLTVISSVAAGVTLHFVMKWVK
ncbi:MAG: hypothetical protein ACE5E4_13255 [Candidatus Binatia bacterium]